MFPQHSSRLSAGRPGPGAPAATHPHQQTANAPGTQWKNPKSLHNRTEASSGVVTAPLLRDSESKGWRKPVPHLDGSDPRAIYVTGVPEMSPPLPSAATLPGRGENFLLRPPPLVISTSRCKSPPNPSPSPLFADTLPDLRAPRCPAPRQQPGREGKNIRIIFLTGIKRTYSLILKQREVNCYHPACDSEM